MWSRLFYIFYATLLLLLLLISPEIGALRMTALQIPQHVVFNQTVKLECHFNLDQESLYSVKWYKDGHEFYRLVPRDKPPVQVFELSGVSVDIANSTERSVVLRNVDLSSTGRYRCEVSAEAPSFQTVSDHADMTVVVLPREGPHISGRLSRYRVGDVVRINCTSAPSKPAAMLTWFINGEPADARYLRGPPHITGVDADGLETAMLGLQFQITSEHIKRGDMKFECLSTIGTVYEKSNVESVRGVGVAAGNVDGDDRNSLKAPESRETRAQSHTRNDLAHGSSSRSWATAGLTSFLITLTILLSR
ncbi:cell adhesion molecule 2-like [Athalia rosae]|uniref:cell adhesion molecule 2-like n=1 Tax=Athalia rosae TaxID=37344 RepID=UPI0006263DDB|nr:cell adhesion molecule 2-like [Athalia rosae]